MQQQVLDAIADRVVSKMLGGNGYVPATTPIDAPTSTPQQPRPYGVVVVRSSGSGVWLGNLDYKNDESRTVILSNARRAWQWQGCLSCSELAMKGPDANSKISGPVETVQVYDVLEVIGTTDAAVTRWKAVPAWAK
jgi:hypothetical protein